MKTVRNQLQLQAKVIWGGSNSTKTPTQVLCKHVRISSFRHNCIQIFVDLFGYIEKNWSIEFETKSRKIQIFTLKKTKIKTEN
jgi:hypothetical protein